MSVVALSGTSFVTARAVAFTRIVSLDGRSFVELSAFGSTSTPALSSSAIGHSTALGLVTGANHLSGSSFTRTQTSGALGLAPSKYLSVLEDLLPIGPAWTRDDDSELTGLLEACSYEFGRVDARVAQLLLEADPLTASEMLPDWLRITGLASDVSLTTPEMQRAAVVAALAAQGGPSIPFITSLAALIGYTITIKETRPFVAGSRAGASLTQGSWVFYWTVHTPTGANDGLLQRLIRKLAPIHTLVVFIFS